MGKQRKSMQPQPKARAHTPSESMGRYGVTPLGGEGELIDLAGSLAKYPGATLSRLIERIKSL